LAERERGPEKRLVTLLVEADGVDVNRDEPLFHNGECVGYVTSGGYAHYTGHSVALGYVPSELASDDTAFEVEILGERRPAKIQPWPLYDPDGARMRS
jgi:dimethylglycine dehydrogenase